MSPVLSVRKTFPAEASREGDSHFSMEFRLLL
jgi:hypothetical protein